MWQDLGGLGGVGVNPGAHQVDQFGTTGEFFSRRDKISERDARYGVRQATVASLSLRLSLSPRARALALLVCHTRTYVRDTRSKQNGARTLPLASPSLENRPTRRKSMSTPLHDVPLFLSYLTSIP